MDRMENAIHEAGHLVACHYAKFEVTKIKTDHLEIIFPPLPPKKEPWDEPGYEGRVYASVPYEERILKWLWSHIHVLSAGFVSEFLYLGDAFWKSNPRSLIMKTSDMAKLNDLTLGKKISRKSIETALKEFHGFLSSPEIWGKVMMLADEIIDNKNLTNKDDVFGQVFKFLIMKTKRQRTPQYNASPLIEFLLTELYRN